MYLPHHSNPIVQRDLVTAVTDREKFAALVHMKQDSSGTHNPLQEADCGDLGDIELQDI